MPADLVAQIQGMEPLAYWLALAGALLLMGVGFKFWRDSFKHARIMEDMPTSKIRSAAQGFVELVGTQTPALKPGPTAPLTGRPVTWWSYKIEKKKTRRDSDGKTRTEWVTVENKTSPDLILLKDATGEAVVNPAGAEVTPKEKKVWYGRHRKPTSAPSGSGSIFTLGSVGRKYRYTERVMLPGDPIYALGYFETRHGVPDSKERARLRGAVLAEWKENPAELAERFDEDGDGRVDMEEWERARKAAEAVVEQKAAEAAEEPEANLLLKPPDGEPFILSVKSQDELTKQYRLRSMGFLVLFIAGVVAVGVLLTARFGGAA